VEESVREAARVLRTGGALIVVDSPMYRDHVAQAKAAERSASYYARVGFPQLAPYYHPIDVAALRAALAASRFETIRLDAGSTAGRWWQRAGRPRRSSFLIAKSNRS
jgi:hypothetical protein